jgi:hypothetical protein
MQPRRRGESTLDVEANWWGQEAGGLQVQPLVVSLGAVSSGIF